MGYLINFFNQKYHHCGFQTFAVVTLVILQVNRAVAQAVRRWLPTAAFRVHVRAEHVGFVVDKAALSRFSPSTSVSPANHHSANFAIIIITQQLEQ
jgi:hypothetical protein